MMESKKNSSVFLKLCLLELYDFCYQNAIRIRKNPICIFQGLKDAKSYILNCHILSDLLLAFSCVGFYIICVFGLIHMVLCSILFVCLMIFTICLKNMDFYTFFFREDPLYYSNKVVWVTGASKGIGLVLSKYLALRGVSGIIITSRNENDLIQTQKEIVNYCKTKGIKFPSNDILLLNFDLSNVEDSNTEKWESLVKTAINWKGRIDMVFCNAGRAGISQTPEVSQYSKMFDTNFHSNVKLVELLLPHMKSRGSGNFIFTNSVAAYIGSSTMAAYASSKSALLTFSRILRQDLRAQGYSNIHITSIHPGVVETRILENAIESKSEKISMPKSLPPGITSDLCASIMLRAASRNIEESWICTAETLLCMYIAYYLPHTFQFIRKFSARIEQKALSILQ